VNLTLTPLVPPNPAAPRPFWTAAAGHARALLILTALVPLLTACSLVSLPSQSKPICSWSSNVPPDADAICRGTFGTISSVLTAAVRGDAVTVRRLVVSGVAARKIFAYGAYVRAAGSKDIHAVAAPTLDARPDGSVFVVFYIVGHTRTGKLSDAEAITLAQRSGRWVVTADERHEAW